MSAPLLRACTHCRAIYRTPFARCPTDGAAIAEVEVDPLIGTTVADRYVVDALIGEGGMGRVYRAHHVHLTQRRVALKVLVGDLAADASMRIRFSQEAASASQLEHPHVVPVSDFGRTADGLLFLAMELVEGLSLGDLAASGPVSPSRVIALARQLCGGLAHAHGRGLVHRDFKPDNVLLQTVDGREVARICDFGLAISEDPDTATRLTSAGLALGTPLYCSPEQARGKPVDHRTDLFALGVTLYELLAGTVPFDGGMVEVLYANATLDPPPIAARAPGVVVPPALEALVRRLMARAPDGRPATADEVRAALDALEADAVTAGAAVTLVAVSGEVAPGEVAPDEVAPPAGRDRRPVRPWLRWLEPAVIVSASAVLGLGWAGAATRGGGTHPMMLMEREPGLPRGNAVRPGPAPAATPSSWMVVAEPPAAASAPPATSPSPSQVPSPSPSPPPSPTPSPTPSPSRVPSPSPSPSRFASPSPSRFPTPSPSRFPSPSPSPSPSPVAVADTAAVAVEARPPESSAPVEVAPAPVEVAPAPPALAPTPARPRSPTRPRLAIARLAIGGSLPRSMVQRAVERVTPQLAACYARLGAATAATVRVHVVIDEHRVGRPEAVSEVVALPTLAGCVRTALAQVRTEEAPDVGVVDLRFDAVFTPGAP